MALQAETAAALAAQQHADRVNGEAQAAREEAEDERSARHAASSKFADLQVRQTLCTRALVVCPACGTAADGKC